LGRLGHPTRQRRENRRFQLNKLKPATAFFFETGIWEDLAQLVNAVLNLALPQYWGFNMKSTTNIFALILANFSGFID
jgi:hypothetical protein